MSPQWKTYSGVIHIHSDSPSGVPVKELIAAARLTSADFLVLTDHGTRHGANPVEGWHGPVLLLTGEEILCPDGHLLAFETRDDVGEMASIQDAIFEVRRQSGTVVGTHYHFAYGKSLPRIPVSLPLRSIDLLEVWSFFDEFLTRVPSRRFLQFHARPERALEGPERKLLRSWDMELTRRNLPIVGSANAHRRKEPLFDWREFFAYETSFKTIRTAVMCPPLPGNAARARDLVWQALRRGNSFVYNRSLGEALDFQFSWTMPDGRSFGMGESVLFEDNGKMSITLPQPAEVVLRRDGLPLFWGSAPGLKFPATAPGAYRVEVYLDGRLWILSNPIRLTVEQEPMQPTVSDFT